MGLIRKYRKRKTTTIWTTHCVIKVWKKRRKNPRDSFTRFAQTQFYYIYGRDKAISSPLCADKSPPLRALRTSSSACSSRVVSSRPSSYPSAHLLLDGSASIYNNRPEATNCTASTNSLSLSIHIQTKVPNNHLIIPFWQSVHSKYN